jgi:hypothetical protein
VKNLRDPAVSSAPRSTSTPRLDNQLRLPVARCRSFRHPAVLAATRRFSPNNHPEVGDCLTVFASPSYIAPIPAICFGMAG